MKRHVFLFVLSFFVSLPLFGQRPPFGQQRGSSQAGGSQDQGEVLVDTFDVFFFYIDNPNQDIPFSDTTLGNYFRQYDPVRQRSLDYKNLGILGSAHEPIVFEAPWRRGFDVGLHQFDLYMTRSQDLPFYRIELPFTDVSYTLGSQQADGYATAAFTRNFADGLNFSLEFKRINQLGEIQQYPNQNTRNTALATGMWLHGKKGHYDGFLSLAANTIEQEDNGGILAEPQEEGDFSSPSSATVFLPTARTRHAHREGSYTHYYRLGGELDSLRGIRRSYTVAHQILLSSSTYKYHDEYNEGQDSTFFGFFPDLLADPRGVRLYFQHRKLENSFRLGTFKLSSGKGAVKRQASDQLVEPGQARNRDAQPGQARNQRDLLEIGAVHTLHWLEETDADSTLNNLFLTGRYRFNPSERLRINLNGHFGLLANAGDYRVNGELFLDLKKIGALTVGATNQLYAPTLMQHRLYLSDQQVYANDFSKTLATSVFATYALPQAKLEVSGHYHLLNNYIYFDTLGLPQQTGIPISIGQLIIRKDFELGAIHLDNTIALQQSSEGFIRLPELFSKHSLYYAGKWFGVLDIRTGFDLRLNSSYFAHYYNPVTGQFQLQDREEVRFYPATDVFFSMQVTKFRAFFKYENATALFITDRLFYQTAYYAHPSAVFRIGLRWRFLD